MALKASIGLPFFWALERRALSFSLVPKATVHAVKRPSRPTIIPKQVQPDWLSACSPVNTQLK